MSFGMPDDVTYQGGSSGLVLGLVLPASSGLRFSNDWLSASFSCLARSVSGWRDLMCRRRCENARSLEHLRHCHCSPFGINGIFCSELNEKFRTGE